MKLLKHASLLAAVLMAGGTLALMTQMGADACPAGQKLRDPVKRALEFNPNLSAAQIEALRKNHGDRVCLPVKLPEPAWEISAVHDMHFKSRGVAPGAYRKALEDKAAMQPLQASVPRAGSEWTAYHRGNLRVGSGYDNVAARVDNFAWDAVNQRLFAAVGTGGV